MRLSVIIPVFNKFSLTRDCLHSLREHAPDTDMEVLVVDNGSTDETSFALAPLGAELFGDSFRAVHLPENRNFGPACNLGAREAEGDFLFFLNNDTVLTPGWYPPLEEALTGDCGAVGPLLMYPAEGPLPLDRVQHLGVVCQPQLHFCHLYEFFPVTHPVVRRPRSPQFLTGAALLLPRRVFFQAGLFHEGYINGAEDLELCVRVKKAGHSLRCVQQSRIYHLQSQTPGRHDHERDNARLFKERNLWDIYPDFHLRLKEDGYETALNEHLVPYARLPRRRGEILDRAFGRDSTAPDMAACLSMMEREPLYGPAYERLADLCEAENDLSLLGEVRFLQARLFPCRSAARRLLDAAVRADDRRLRREGERLVEFYDRLAVDPDLPAMAREMVDFGERLEQPGLSGLYADWLEGRGL
ncbi:glycosyltransferase family 2 protein [uncultured Pseudodesulfovibrio sp.]|uniref:glycosyltransferase family 2 protein n=1 Tax=uncultured Pseudodesulfovibrio sp. TaxID=2035858 RepID=UPI0029C749EF|nr:glycosyltransferase family 2 protein [uncultured Pseudodesulfovibrio sp.]